MGNTSNLIQAEELHSLIEDSSVQIVDASWYLPTQNRNVPKEYADRHIAGAVFFDIDQISDTASELPHMLPDAEQFSNSVSELGIANHHRVVVYDTSGLFSAARVWWMFRVFGHTDIQVLNGGLPAWLAAGYDVTDTREKIRKEFFSATLDVVRVKTKEQMISNTRSRDSIVLDARPLARFQGKAPEPRPGLPSGHIPYSVSLPYDQLLDQGKLKTSSELRQVFDNLNVSKESSIITSCGSGVTAAIITLALHEAGYGLHSLYDGAWAEWGASNNCVVEVSP